MNIEELEQKIKAMESRYESDIKAIESQCKSDTEVLLAELNAIKKDDEFESVFGGKWAVLWSECVTPISDVPESVIGVEHGDVFRTEELAEADRKRRIARAYVIEEINKINKGDNGFKVGENNWCLLYSYGEKKLLTYMNEENQTQDKELYIRSVSDVNKLIEDARFVDSFKTMRGIK